MAAFKRSHRPVAHLGIAYEAVTVLRRHATGDVAAPWGRGFYESGVEFLAMCDDDWVVAMEFLTKFPEQKLSAVDAVSFALIRRHNVEDVLSFDKHFRIVLSERNVLPQ